MRNEICVLLNYIVSCQDSHPFFLQTDGNSDECILEQMINYAVNDEIIWDVDREQPIFNVTDEDLELKKLLSESNEIHGVKLEDHKSLEHHQLMCSAYSL